MNFTSALFSLKRGHKIKRHHWTGYWYLDTNHEVIMHTFDDHIVNIRNSNDILYTLENIACDDWEICDNEHAEKELNNKPLTIEEVEDLKNRYNIQTLNRIIAQYIEERNK